MEGRAASWGRTEAELSFHHGQIKREMPSAKQMAEQHPPQNCKLEQHPQLEQKHSSVPEENAIGKSTSSTKHGNSNVTKEDNQMVSQDVLNCVPRP